MIPERFEDLFERLDVVIDGAVCCGAVVLLELCPSVRLCPGHVRIMHSNVGLAHTDARK